jgi:hypothetical protein
VPAPLWPNLAILQNTSDALNNLVDMKVSTYSKTVQQAAALQRKALFG